MEDYKIKYEKAIEQAKKELQAYGSLDCDAARQIFRFFPELVENEDERIRKSLIKSYTNQHPANFPTVDGFTREQILAWLEKQKLLNNDKYQTVPVEILDRLYKSEKELEELKQGEHKLTNNVEPKFKVGDWVVNKKTGMIHQIRHVIEVVSNNTYGYDLTDGGCITPSNSDKYRLWDIPDAKIGNIIIVGDEENSKGIAIYGKDDAIGNNILFCIYDDENGFNINAKIAKECLLHPATEEQCRLLFSKMKEAGYKWDNEKKELKKIELKSTKDNCKISDWDMKVDTIEYNNGYECGKQRVLKYPEDYGLCKKPAWNEEDEEKLKEVISEFEAMKNISSTIFEKNLCDDKITFLKSLKERIKGDKQ